ncbi:MAG: hypothetical protein Q9227_002809 [Pyrenula ochraceoflavens]
MSEPEENQNHTSQEKSALGTSSQDQTGPKITENSDGEAGERPVREKLKKTSIAGLSQHTTAQEADRSMNDTPNIDSAEPEVGSDHAQRGRPARKRSYEDIQQEELQTESTADKETASTQSLHKRMRSRDVSAPVPSEPNGKDSARRDPVIHEEEHSISQLAASTAEEEDSNGHKPPTPEQDLPEDGTREVADGILSPRKKRSRDQFDKDCRAEGDGSEISAGSIIDPGSDIQETTELSKSVPRNAGGEPEKKRHRDASSERDNQTKPSQSDPPAKSKPGFSNTSAVSPFGAPTSPKKSHSPRSEAESKATSNSAFASSGLSAFASSEKSPFGAAGTTSNSGFGFRSSEPASQSGFGSSALSGSGFGGTSPFATSGSSAFGGQTRTGFGGGFGSALGATKPQGGFSSFGAPTASSGILGSNANSNRAFGAPEVNEEQDDDSEDDENNEEESRDEKSKDKRFHEQEGKFSLAVVVETGEEAEETVFSCKAKLYHFDTKEWKERGVGSFKVNVSDDKEAEDPGKKKARLIFRTEGVHRVALNTPVFKDMKVGSNDGKEPNGKMLNLAAMENGKPVPLLLKTGSLDLARDLYRHIKSIQELL